MLIYFLPNMQFQQEEAESIEVCSRISLSDTGVHAFQLSVYQSCACHAKPDVVLLHATLCILWIRTATSSWH
jgi:hypothetical protein